MEGPADSELPIVVQKYGGSSVADPEKLRQVAERVAATVRQGRRVVVVVSAMGKTTDQLIALAHAVHEQPSRRELDMLLSTGERISMALLAMALDRLGIEAISFTGSQSGILTNDRHSGAHIIEVRPVRIQDELARGKVVIVAGFQGMSYKREITTLGRGGSDTTAVALAAALGAAHCEICSDVDGVYSADPRVVPDARRIDAIGYDEMQELAEHGARVLHAQAVEWARRAGIVVHARATASPPDGDRQAGTRIGPLPPGREGAVAVTGAQRLLRVRAAGGGEALLSALRDEGVALRRLALAAGADAGGLTGAPADPCAASGHPRRRAPSAEAVFAPDDVPDLGRVLARLRERAPDCAVDEPGAVTAVGAGAGTSPRRVEAALEAVAAVGAMPDAVDVSPRRITIYLEPARVEDATRALHRVLVEAAEQGG